MAERDPQGWEPPDAGKRVMVEEATSVGEWIGGLIILAIVITLCLLVLHWAGVL